MTILLLLLACRATAPCDDVSPEDTAVVVDDSPPVDDSATPTAPPCACNEGLPGILGIPAAISVPAGGEAIVDVIGCYDDLVIDCGNRVDMFVFIDAGDGIGELTIRTEDTFSVPAVCTFTGDFVVSTTITP